MTHYCPACGEVAVPPRGNKDSRILIIGEFPGESEMESGKPFSGPAGGVLRTELAKVGLDVPLIRVMNLWLHPVTKDEKCYKAGYDLVLEEAKGRDAILLVGSEVVNTFTNEYKVSEICGLKLDKADHKLSARLVMAIVNPAIVFHSGIGEVRFGIQKFAEELELAGIDEGKLEDDDDEDIDLDDMKKLLHVAVNTVTYTKVPRNKEND